MNLIFNNIALWCRVVLMEARLKVVAAHINVVQLLFHVWCELPVAAVCVGVC